MYGAKLIIGNNTWKFDNSLAGYKGWIHTNKKLNPSGDYGDVPLIFASKLTIKKKNIDYFAQYQYGINDFPYHQLRLGISFSIEKLTPKF